MPGLDILWAGVTVGRRRGGGGGCLREVGVAGEAEAIWCHLCLLSRRGGCSAGDLKPLGASPYPSWPSLALHCLIQSQVLCPRAISWKLATLAQGPSHPALPSLACPRPIFPASLHERRVDSIAFPPGPEKAPCLVLLTPVAQHTIQYNSTGAHTV